MALGLQIRHAESKMTLALCLGVVSNCIACSRKSSDALTLFSQGWFISAISIDSLHGRGAIADTPDENQRSRVRCSPSSCLCCARVSLGISLPRDLGYGLGTTCLRMLFAWQDAGIWQRISETLLAALIVAANSIWRVP